MDEKKLRGLLGLCVRARQATFGEDGCLKAVRSGDCAVLLVDSGASKATREKYAGACENAGVPLRMLREDLLEEATGRPGRAMVVRPGGLAQQILTISSDESPEIQPMKSANNCGGASVE